MNYTINPFTGQKNSQITELTETLKNNDLHSGRMISGSKSGYRDTHPNGYPIFNACIYNSKAKQIWWGDLDMNEDKEILQKVANDSNQEFYVTTESYRSDFNKITKKDLEKGMTPKFSTFVPVFKFKPNNNNA